MTIMGRCLIEIDETTRENLRALGVKRNVLSFSTVIDKLIEEHHKSGLGSYVVAARVDNK